MNIFQRVVGCDSHCILINKIAIHDVAQKIDQDTYRVLHKSKCFLW